ncbi:uncharacterized protein HaLaN_19073 [Haematococcus lacustris]|uniref:Uncharacterized protein n=1 Tax=Haematococcus lacustris TaxID=44745 RepID=A0A699ZIB1_HAELA|nr:uncharacterized protein HaLaN_19073 [Haematococcus lacustris]
MTGRSVQGSQHMPHSQRAGSSARQQRRTVPRAMRMPHLQRQQGQAAGPGSSAAQCPGLGSPPGHPKGRMQQPQLKAACCSGRRQGREGVVVREWEGSSGAQPAARSPSSACAVSEERAAARQLLSGFDPLAHVGERHNWMLVLAPEQPMAEEECIIMFNRLQSEALRGREGIIRSGVLGSGRGGAGQRAGGGCGGGWWDQVTGSRWVTLSPGALTDDASADRSSSTCMAALSVVCCAGGRPRCRALPATTLVLTLLCAPLLALIDTA